MRHPVIKRSVIMMSTGCCLAGIPISKVTKGSTAEALEDKSVALTAVGERLIYFSSAFVDWE